MTYAVHHVDAEGRTQLEDVGCLEEALSRVEDLRNDGAVSEVRILKEVPIEVRTYYRVVAVEEEAVGAGDAPAGPQLAAAAAELVPEEQLGVEAVAAFVEEPEPPRVATVFGEPPSGAVVMGPPPASSGSHEAAESPAEPAQEPRRALFGRS